MEIQKVKITEGIWKPNFSEESLIIGKDNINIAKFDNLDIPYEERWGNLLLASSSKAMLVRINQVSKILDSYVERNENFGGLSSGNFQNLFKSRMEYLYTMLQSVLPKAFREDLNSSTDSLELMVNYLENAYTVLSEADKKVFKNKIKAIIK